ncbi:MAG: hypothetical protein WC679_12760 [Bacteroidales bacterium]|jgi:hypothetical protein
MTNTATANTTWSPSFSASSLSSEVPVLPNGIYAGKLVNVSIVGKENKQYFTIRKAQVWNKEDKKFEDVIENGVQKYILSGMILMQVALTSKRAAKTLGRDEPQFVKMLNVTFNDNFNPDDSKNQQVKKFLEVLGLENEPFEQYVSFEFNPEIEVPEELAEVENAIGMLNALEYYRQLFNIICNSCKDQNVKVSIEKKTAADGQVSNEIGGGRTAPGVLKYEAGCEEDLPQE